MKEVMNGMGRKWGRGRFVFLWLWVAPFGWADSGAWDLLSYNIRIDFTGSSWSEREEAIERILTERPYDIVALQEMSEFMLASIQAMLPDYNYVVGERSDGHRNDQRWYEFVPVFWNPERFEKLAAGSFWVGDDPDEPGGNLDETKHHGRVFTWVHFRDRTRAETFVMGNVHIHGQRSHDAVDIIVGRLRSRFPDTPLVLAGDYNARPDGEAYRRMREVHRFQDAHLLDSSVREVTTLALGETLPGDNGNIIRGRGGARIDYIFLTPEFQVDAYEIIQTTIREQVFPSDHMPLAATIAFRRE